MFRRGVLGNRRYDPFNQSSYGYADPLLATEERIMTDELIETTDPGSAMADFAQADEEFAEIDLITDLF